MFFVVISVVIACTPVSSPTPTEVVQSTVQVEMVEHELEQGGTLVFPVAEEAPTLNPYLSQTGWEALITQTIYEGLAAVDSSGNFYPVLAKELPTRDNGGVSTDGLMITWKLKEGVVWSDGKPFTAEDVRFTWEAVSHPESGAIWAPGADLIESIEIPDENTVIIKYSQYYPDYLGQLSSTSTAGQGILPKHACGEPSQMSKWDCNRNPVGTGPFMLEEWRTGDHIRIVRNPLYREERKPLLDAIVFPVVPNAEVHKQMMMRGDADAWFEFDQQYLDELSAADRVQINPGSAQWLLRLFFNLGERGAEDPEKLNPILADRRVREAIQFAIDRDAINSGVYDGKGKPVGQELYHGPFTCPSPELIYDPEAAKTLLEEAGWVDADGDGIRECHNCINADEGHDMHLVFKIKAGSQPYALTQQLVVDMLLEVGIKVEPMMVESSVLDSVAMGGDFDLLMWSDGYEPAYDPGVFLKLYYWSESIPPTSWNIMRFKDERIDELLLRAEKTVNQEDRHQIYCQVNQILTEEVPVNYLLVLPFPSVFSARVQGWEANPNAILTWDAANWWLEE